MRYSKVFFTFLISTFALLANAQSAGTTIFDEIVYNWRNAVSIETMYTYTGKSDISKDRNGDFSSNSIGATFKIQGVSSSKKHALTSYINYNYLNADFDCINKPFDEISTLTLSTFYVYKINEKWAAFADGRISFSAEDTSDWGDGTQGSIGLGAIYSFSDEFKLGFGAVAYSRLDRDWLGFPIAFIDWKITERLTLRTFSGAALMYDALGNGLLIVDVKAEYKNSYARLNDNSSIRDSYGEFSVGALARPSKRFFVGARLGVNFAREMEFRKSSIRKIEVDPAPTFSIFGGINW